MADKCPKCGEGTEVTRGTDHEGDCIVYSCGTVNDLPKAKIVEGRGCLLEQLAQAQAKNEPLEVVCICGSTRWSDEHAIARWVLERTGRYIALMINYLPSWWAEREGWAGNDHFGEAAGCKDCLDELHKRKIDMADWVLVIAPQGYVGESTRSEIEYAESKGMPVRYVEQGSEAREAAEAEKDGKPKPE